MSFSSATSSYEASGDLRRRSTGVAVLSSEPMGSTPYDRLVSQSFVSDLEKIMTKVSKNPLERHYADLTKYLYSHVHPKGFLRSGSECAELLFSGMMDEHYTIPRAEAKFIERNSTVVCDLFRKVFPNKDVVHVSLGCGPYTPVFVKDVPISRACNITKYVAVDINQNQAQQAAKIVEQRVPNISTSFIAQDFTKRMHIEPETQDQLVLMTLFGDTMGQYPYSFEETPKTTNATSLKKLLINFGKSTNFSGILFATLDAESDATYALSKYQGTSMYQLMNTLWGTAREVTGDSSFDPFAFSYTAEVDRKNNSILFVHTARKCTSLTIKDQKYDIPKGTEIVIGCSQKTTPERIMPVCEEAGWVPMDVPFQYDSTTRGMILVGKNLARSLPHL